MAKKVQDIGLYVLIVLVILLGLYLMCSRVEGFKEEPVPDICGKYGWGFSAGLQKYLKDYDGSGTAPYRMYSPSGCTGIGGSFQYGQCLKLKFAGTSGPNNQFDTSQKNIEKDYNELCKGLNSQKTPAPSECNVDGKALGKGNAAASFTFRSKPLKLSANSIRLYTQDECDLLNGQFIGVSLIEKETKKSLTELVKEANKEEKVISLEDVNKILAANGRDRGICYSKDLPLSIACASAEESSGFQRIIDMIKKEVKNIL
jgi:hypothetical protein